MDGIEKIIPSNLFLLNLILLKYYGGYYGFWK